MCFIKISKGEERVYHIPADVLQNSAFFIQVSCQKETMNPKCQNDVCFGAHRKRAEKSFFQMNLLKFAQNYSKLYIGAHPESSLEFLLRSERIDKT